ncbi:hypothetical protein [Granulicella tundricola]|uniref:NADH:flavin oxidoreductase, NADH oxidase n=1 Tax=Granulicella tundricola (strain ATCC BAA-1859 / DSM 23138 / MP5ACTX9) TaxID=1198114 RepID=E8X1B3_GRATM|nr:hypothetical protein [Granulicella tundricola]ADW69067.1 NADH:flavin oxidoreductase, NADH oxidase [Granulicella tundricola MP5ACTX9]
MPKLEHASASSTRKIKPPTTTEFSEAARRGHKTLTGDVLKEIRTGKLAVRSSAVAPDPAIATLRKRVIALESEKTRLKVQMMNAG